MQPEILKYKNWQIQIRRRAYQRRIVMSVKPDGRVLMTAPKRVSEKWLQQMVDENEAWLQKALLKYQNYREQNPSKKLMNGEKILFFGKTFKLSILKDKRKKVEIFDEVLQIMTPDLGEPMVREILQNFYKKQATLVFKERIDFFSQRLQLYPQSISFRAQKTRWGSCSGRGHISLNWKLAIAPLECLDYVVVHELCHLQHKNHSQHFWDLVEKYQPQFREHQQWLKAHAREFDFLG